MKMISVTYIDKQTGFQDLEHMRSVYNGEDKEGEKCTNIEYHNNTYITHVLQSPEEIIEKLEIHQAHMNELSGTSK